MHPGSRDRLAARVRLAQRWLERIYRLGLPIRADRFLVAPDLALGALPAGSPRTGLAILEEGPELFLGLYFHASDAGNPAVVLEETSHFLAVAWNAVQRRRVSPLLLELQAEVDRYALARFTGGEPLGHFRHFRWASWLGEATLGRYQAAHGAAYRYCRWLDRRYPQAADLPELLRELRCFYRRTGDAKLRAGA